MTSEFSPPSLSQKPVLSAAAGGVEESRRAVGSAPEWPILQGPHSQPWKCDIRSHFKSSSGPCKDKQVLFLLAHVQRVWGQYLQIRFYGICSNLGQRQWWRGPWVEIPGLSELLGVTFLPKSAKPQCAFVSVISSGKNWVFCYVCEVLYLMGWWRAGNIALWWVNTGILVSSAEQA